MLIATAAPVTTGLWAGTHHGLETAGYLAAGLISLALAPALFVILDQVVVVRWSNAVLDLVSLK
jgi:hypothetical protein